MKKVTFRFVAAHTPVSWLIRLFTWSRYSHVEVMVDKGWLGASWGGVKIRPYGYYRASSVRAVTVEMEDKDYGRMMDWLYNQVGKPYDFMAVIGIVFRRNWRSENKWFCSELVARAFEVGDKPLIRADHVSRVTPAMLDLSTLAETLGCMGG